MTTTIIVKANHGWPVDVKGFDPKTGDQLSSYGDRVTAGDTREFSCHSHMDLRVHEVQPDEVSAPFDRGSASIPSVKFAFRLGQDVKLSLSGERGTVIGRAEYLRIGRQYTVEYLTADGRQTNAWFDEEALVAA